MYSLLNDLSTAIFYGEMHELICQSLVYALNGLQLSLEWSFKCSITEGLLQISISETVHNKLIVNNPFLLKPVFFMRVLKLRTLFAH